MLGKATYTEMCRMTPNEIAEINAAIEYYTELKEKARQNNK